jgi:hypothetical protein
MRDHVNDTSDGTNVLAMIDEVARHPERAEAIKHRLLAQAAQGSHAAGDADASDDDAEDLWDNVPI